MKSRDCLEMRNKRVKWRQTDVKLYVCLIILYSAYSNHLANVFNFCVQISSLSNLWKVDLISFSSTNTSKSSSKQHCNEYAKCWKQLATLRLTPGVRMMAIESLVHSEHNVTDDSTPQTDWFDNKQKTASSLWYHKDMKHNS